MSGWGSIYNSTTFSMRTHSARMAELQRQASTGSRVTRVSDDPSDANRILYLGTESATLASYVENLHSVVQSMGEASNSLEQVSSGLARVQELLTQAVNGTLNDSNKRAISEEISALLKQTVALANHKSMGRYVFSGASPGVKPYVAEYADGKIVSVSYQGSHLEMPVPVGQGVEQAGIFVGEEIFRSDNRQDPTFLGKTGAAGGDATHSVQGDVWLALTHTATDYAAGAHGLAAGDDSADEDTILGEHTLTVTASGRQIQLDGGPAVTFTPGQTNVEVTNADGDVVHVDVSGWSGLDESVTITGTGTASVDGGATTTPVDDFAAELAVTDGESGRVLNLDTTGIRREGVEPVRVPGTYDVFDSLIQIRDALANDVEMDRDTRQDFMERSLESLDEVTAAVTESMTTIGARLSAMDKLQNSLEGLQSESKMERSRLSDADIAQVAVDLARTQTLYQMTLASASKLLSLSLLDFI